MAKTVDAETFILRLQTPGQLWSRAEVLRTPSPVPAEPGVYGWYFREVPSGVPIDGCVSSQGARLVYIGISPSRPPSEPGKRGPNLRKRIRQHYRGNASGSTLRLTLGCLLAHELGLRLMRSGSGRLTFGAGEQKLSQWMDRNAMVAWYVHPKPWDVETLVIEEMDLPFNLQHNKDHAFHDTLSMIRRKARESASAGRQEAGKESQSR